MTEAQQIVLDFIVDYTAEEGYPPTVREVAEELEWSSPSTAHDTLLRLRTAGYVTWKPGSNRTLRVISGGSPS